MDTTQIKKSLYKQSPVAILEFIRKGVAHYTTVIKDEHSSLKELYVRFEVPVNDMGDAYFTSHMEAKLLIRYIIN